MKEGYVLNPQTNRIISTKTAKYKKLVKLGLIVEDKPKVEKVEKPQKVEVKEAVIEPEVEADEEQPFDEAKLQMKLADISTSVVKKNMKQIIKNQKLSDNEYDLLLKKMLYKKLCSDEPKEKVKPKKVKKPKKNKFKLKEPSSSESESESD